MVITITPLAALVPYKAVEEASFKTVIFAISEGFNVLNIDEEIGAPSRMNNGVLLELIEFTPRRRIVADAEGSPVADKTESPETCPDKASVKLGVTDF